MGFLERLLPKTPGASHGAVAGGNLACSKLITASLVSLSHLQTGPPCCRAPTGTGWP